ncbi:hypothetical protein M9Y10_007022 [Tritrichomonas musculus]|uniref:Microbial-type PARG catalytic domain-containing protein n=1 Tax=Tritrichomonas musculus TaxID=1915356 RepID=A0ABR2J072_9EUKA
MNFEPSSPRKTLVYKRAYRSKFTHIRSNVDQQSTVTLTTPRYDPANTHPYYSGFLAMKNKQPKIPLPYKLEERIRQRVAEENQSIQSQYPLPDEHQVETLYDIDHVYVAVNLGLPPRYKHSPIYITKESSINAAITFHTQDENYQICILNFTDSTEPGKGFKYGHRAQESSNCLQTLIYPTLVDNRLYGDNAVNGRSAEGSNTMIYSSNIYVIRDEGCKRVKNPFLINIISSTPVNNQKRVVPNADRIMEDRIRKIITLAAAKKNDVLVIGDFGCGKCQNDPKVIAQIFRKVLVTEGMKNHFTAVVIPIYSGPSSFNAFRSAIPDIKLII